MFEVGPTDLGRPFASQFPPLLVQSNMRFKCGPDGALGNECIVSGAAKGGNTLVLSNDPFAKNERVAKNVTFEGITFQSGLDSFLDLQNGGDITFRNCLFRVSRWC